MDEEDMRKKYESKPNQLASILENGKTRVCPVRGVKLWQDPQYALKQLEEESVRGKHMREARQDTVVKPHKKAKHKNTGKKRKHRKNTQNVSANWISTPPYFFVSGCRVLCVWWGTPGLEAGYPSWRGVRTPASSSATFPGPGSRRLKVGTVH